MRSYVDFLLGGYKTDSRIGVISVYIDITYSRQAGRLPWSLAAASTYPASAEPDVTWKKDHEPHFPCNITEPWSRGP